MTASFLLSGCLQPARWTERPGIHQAQLDRLGIGEEIDRIPWGTKRPKLPPSKLKQYPVGVLWKLNRSLNRQKRWFVEALARLLANIHCW
ncbi:MAG: hypothetical protein U9R58_03135 [Chloroflexota bacterium]|nr:hypothetical protein [Chloroflexota bacterium]